MRDEIKLLCSKIDKVLAWMDTHDSKHAYIEEKSREVRDEVYGATPDQDGLKGDVRQIKLRCNGLCGTRQWFFDVSKNIVANGLLMFILWLLYLYAKNCGKCGP